MTTVTSALPSVVNKVHPVLVPGRDSGEIVHRSETIDGVPRPRRIEIRANTGSYVHVRCEKGP